MTRQYRRRIQPEMSGEEANYLKFSKLRLGVRPRWPWYFEPCAPEPYGFSAGDVIVKKLIWPIFMPGYNVIGRLARFASSSVTCPSK